jgi:hypothetical protein
MFRWRIARADRCLRCSVVAPAIAGVQKEIDLVLGLAKADIAGAISVEVTDKFLIDPTIKINLGGVKVYLEVDLEASAAVSTSVELLASTRLDLAVSLRYHPFGQAYANRP